MLMRKDRSDKMTKYDKLYYQEIRRVHKNIQLFQLNVNAYKHVFVQKKKKNKKTCGATSICMK